MKTIMLNVNDVPTVSSILDAIVRLRKDYELLKRVRGKKDKQRPESMLEVANFLEMLVRREKRNLNKEQDDVRIETVKSTIDFMVDLDSLSREDKLALVGLLDGGE
jgi:hypothetical protein